MSTRLNFILRKSNLSKEFFVKNKKSYQQSIISNRQTNYNRIIYRKFHAYEPLFGGSGNGEENPNPNNNNQWLLLLGLSLWYSLHYRMKK